MVQAAAALAGIVTLVACVRTETTDSVPAQRAAAPLPAAVSIDPATIASAVVSIPELEYRPLLRDDDEPSTQAVPAFALEQHAVTNRQFRAFVLARPKWQRSRVARLFADTNYLRHWVDDVTPGDAIEDRPVTHVSWFAARAYARFIGRRLPTVAEWEAVAAASETANYGREEPGFVQRILEWYAKPSPRVPNSIRSTFANVHGAWDMHGLIWEWTEDFNTALVTGESRGDPGLERNLFCGAGSIGAADPSDYAAFMRSAFRSSIDAEYGGKNLGFRCARDLPDRE